MVVMLLCLFYSVIWDVVHGNTSNFHFHINMFHITCFFHYTFSQNNRQLNEEYKCPILRVFVCIRLTTTCFCFLFFQHQASSEEGQQDREQVRIHWSTTSYYIIVIDWSTNWYTCTSYSLAYKLVLANHWSPNWCQLIIGVQTGASMATAMCENGQLGWRVAQLLVERRTSHQ